MDKYDGPADICASLTAYGAFGPFTDLAPPSPPPPVVGVTFQQAGKCLVLAGEHLALGDCEAAAAQWLQQQTKNILDPELGRVLVCRSPAPHTEHARNPGFPYCRHNARYARCLLESA